MGSGAATVTGTVIAWFLAKYTGRTIAGCYTLCLSIVGVIMMFAIPAENYRARYGGYVLTQQCKPAPSPPKRDLLTRFSRYLRSVHHHLLDCRCRWLYKEIRLRLRIPTVGAILSSQITSPFHKDFHPSIADLPSGFAVGNIVGPQTYKAKDGPNYYVSAAAPPMPRNIALEDTDSLTSPPSTPCSPSSCSRYSSWPHTASSTRRGMFNVTSRMQSMLKVCPDAHSNSSLADE